MKPNTKHKEPRGVLFSDTQEGRKDAHLHAELEPANSYAADAFAISFLMKETGCDRANARRIIGLSRGYGG